LLHDTKITKNDEFLFEADQRRRKTKDIVCIYVYYISIFYPLYRRKALNCTLFHGKYSGNVPKFTEDPCELYLI